MLFTFLADLTVVIHLAFVLFAVLGGFLVLRWRPVVWAHVPAAAWGIWIELGGWMCPLTPLEQWLRLQGGRPAYTTSFTEHYLLPLLYPAALTQQVQWALAGAVFLVNAAAYAVVIRRQRRPME